MPAKNSKYVVIVESPAKAKTIERYLGKDYEVIASKGHIRDLPKKSFGVDLENNFEPEFEIMPGKKKVITEIKKKVKNKKVLLASDMDREGEAIAWHLANILKLKEEENNRIIFSEITKNTINESVQEPQKIDLNKVDAQLARRILDRVVGYKVSPLVWKVLKNYKTSAGRVQSAALKVMIDREREIFKFKPKEFFKIFLDYKEQKIPLVREDGKRLKQENIDKDKKDYIIDYLKGKEISLKDTKTKKNKRKQPTPFITSTLQQAAINYLGWTSKKTMQIAQKLYEGMDTSEGHIAFITYMRTDSTRISADAQNAAKKYLKDNFGEKYSGKYSQKKTKQKTQDAHEAIRPTNIFIDDKKSNSLLKGDYLKLYKLIWNRFMASQTSSSVYDETKYIISDENKKYDFEITSKKRIFDGFEKFWKYGNSEVEFEMSNSEIVDKKYLKTEQKETTPPARFSEATIVKELESNGVGRPSTYSTIISTLINRKYVNKFEKKYLRPTIAGFIVNDFIENNFPEIVDIKFTARMEKDLDEIEEGENSSTKVLNEFYEDFSEFLDQAEKKIKEENLDINYESDVKCSKCDKNMELKFGRYGFYLACDEEKCKETQKIPFYAYGITLNNKLHISEFLKDFKENNNVEIGEKCPKCGSELVLKKGRFGEFIACSNYPDCKFTKSVPARGNCPICGSEVGKNKSKKGKIYFKCTNKDCGEMFWNEPSGYNDPDTGDPLFYKFKQKEEKLYNPKTKAFFDKEEIEED
ncbi:MAG: type I DNA topoisomerase [Thermotogota bacterium]